MTETELKTAVAALARTMGWEVYSATWKRDRKVQKGARGYPDLTLARRGEHLWMELKQEGKWPSEEQIRWGAAIGSGFYIIHPSDLDSGFVAGLLR